MYMAKYNTLGRLHLMSRILPGLALLCLTLQFCNMMVNATGVIKDEQAITWKVIKNTGWIVQVG